MTRIHDITNIERLRKIALAAERHPDGAPSAGWRPGDGTWSKNVQVTHEGQHKPTIDVSVKIMSGFVFGRDWPREGQWSKPYARCYDFKSNPNGCLDIEADSILEALEAADKWIAKIVEATPT